MKQVLSPSIPLPCPKVFPYLASSVDPVLLIQGSLTLCLTAWEVQRRVPTHKEDQRCPPTQGNCSHFVKLSLKVKRGEFSGEYKGLEYLGPRVQGLLWLRILLARQGTKSMWLITMAKQVTLSPAANLEN